MRTSGRDSTRAACHSVRLKSLPQGPRDAITDVQGIRVGHWTNRRAGTGCTVVLCEGSTFAAADARGGAPGTRELATLDPANIEQTCHAILLSGGSAFGLSAADGVMRALEERGVGFTTATGPVPIVPGAVIYDLGLGKATVRPGPDEGYRAATTAKGGRVAEGSVGAGTGATVAKVAGPENIVKGGVGTASVSTPEGVVVGALAVVNAIGVITEPTTGEVVAGARGKPGRFLGLEESLRARAAFIASKMENTTLVVVATNASLGHGQMQRLAYQAHNGIARTILPAHTSGDGDTTFAVSMGTVEVQPQDFVTIGLMATLAVERAIVKGVRAATGLHGVPSAGEWLGRG